MKFRTIVHDNKFVDTSSFIFGFVAYAKSPDIIGNDGMFDLNDFIQLNKEAFQKNDSLFIHGLDFLNKLNKNPKMPLNESFFINFTYLLKTCNTYRGEVFYGDFFQNFLSECEIVEFESTIKPIDSHNKPIPMMEAKEFREFGYLQEVNRSFFHPLGLQLVSSIDSNGDERILGVADYRNTPGGVIFNLANSSDERNAKFKKCMENVLSQFNLIGMKRIDMYDYEIEPIKEVGHIKRLSKSEKRLSLESIMEKFENQSFEIENKFDEDEPNDMVVYISDIREVINNMITELGMDDYLLLTKFEIK